MKKKKISLLISKEVAKKFKILSVELDTTMTLLLERAMEQMIIKHKNKKTGFTQFGQYGIKSVPNKKITQAEREDILTVETVLPIRDLTEV